MEGPADNSTAASWSFQEAAGAFPEMSRAWGHAVPRAGEGPGVTVKLAVKLAASAVAERESSGAQLAERVTRTERLTGEAPAVIAGAADWGEK